MDEKRNKEPRIIAVLNLQFDWTKQNGHGHEFRIETDSVEDLVRRLKAAVQTAERCSFQTES